MPVNAQIPLSGIAPKISSPSDLMSLRNLAAETRTRESELEYLPKKRRMLEQEFDLNRQSTLADIASKRYATEWEKQKKDEEFRTSVRSKGLNAINLGRSAGYADNIIVNNMRSTMLDELDRAHNSGRLAMMGIDEAGYEERRAAIMNATIEQIETAAMTQEQAMERAQYPAAGGQPMAPQGGAVPLSQVGQAPAAPQEQPLDQGAPQIFKYGQEPAQGINGEAPGPAPQPLPQAPAQPTVPLQEVSRGTPKAMAPWEELRARADAMEARGGKVNYERAKDMRADADRLEDNARAERQLQATIKDREEKENSRIQAERFKQNDQENKLSDDFLRQSKVFIDTKDAYTRIAVSAQDSSAAGDLSMIFNYMKMLDPGSTVREGEFATAENSAGVGERVRAWYNKVMTGERLTEKQRLDFLDRAQRIYRGILKNHEGLEDQFRERAKRSKVDPDNVIIDLRPRDLPVVWTPSMAQRLRELEAQDNAPNK